MNDEPKCYAKSGENAAQIEVEFGKYQYVKNCV